jgi:mediator of RNA polymerase II transcription subunit 12
MTSLPASGIQDSLQHRAAGGGRGRPPSRAPYVAQEEHVGLEDPAVKHREPASLKTKPVPLDSLQTSGDSFRLPPRGMPQLLFNTVASNAPLHSPYGQLMNVGTPLPVPPRPGSSFPADSHTASRIIPGGTGVKGDAALIIPGNDAPAIAVMFPGGSMFDKHLLHNRVLINALETADFFPWTGNNSEDILSETLVKGGISNKPQIMNETNTARPSLWSNLKNKNGTNMLSKLFVEVLEKRQSCGRLTAPNSFKPPPRLTLRDSTRETWLHDLANPTANLRRLSRTIPHGVTGVVLLEQCLNKNIPLPRAVWLAKCVGINEMRSHKRKGQAGTITWVRAWTGSVEQFLDSTIAMLGQPDWKPRITYA